MEEIPRDAPSSGLSSMVQGNTDLDITVDNRNIPIKGRVLGNDGLRPVVCHIKDSTCDLCLEFIRSALCTQTFKGGNKRWIWKHCNNLKSYPTFQHYISGRKLKASAQAGCGLCTAMLSAGILEEDDPMVFAGRGFPSLEGENHAKNYKQEWWSTFHVSALKKFEKNGTDYNNDFEYEIVLAEDEHECLSLPLPYIEYGFRTSPATHASSDTCYDQLNSWYSACAKQHEKCVRRKLPLPRRLLDIEEKKDSSDCITLRESQNIPTPSEQVQYVALSYCWGDISRFSTTTHNISERLSGIIFEELPDVVQNAVDVIRRLNIRYLWVDAYCILQDNQIEWEAEAAKMADVYGGCVFTLSALSSPDSTTPFLGDRHSRPVDLGVATISYGTWEDDVKIFIRRIPRCIRAEIWRCPLSKRAWPLQEKILAPAVLHYARDQLIWECNENHLCSETGEIEAWEGAVIRTSDVTGCEDLLPNPNRFSVEMPVFSSAALMHPP